MSIIPLVRRLYQPVAAKDLPDPQTLTASFATLGTQFAIAHASQISVKMRYLRDGKAAGSRKLTYKVQCSDDSLDVAEADSVWHDVGDQDNTSGVLTEQPFTYEKTVDADDVYLVPFQFASVAQKCRIQVKEDGAANFGEAQATVGLLRLV